MRACVRAVSSECINERVVERVDVEEEEELECEESKAAARMNCPRSAGRW